MVFCFGLRFPVESFVFATASSHHFIRGVGDVTGTNSIYVGPVLTTTYTLTASAGSNSVTQPLPLLWSTYILLYQPI